MQVDNTKKKKTTSNLLTDNRFKELFTNSDFQIDTNAEEYVLLNPVISQGDKRKRRKLAEEEVAEAMVAQEEQDDG